MQDENIARIVIDNGSHMCKAGFAGDDAPRSVFPSIVGKSEGGKDPYVGDEGRNSPRGFIKPIKHGIIEDWDAMEKVWFHTLYNELRISPEDHAIVLTEPPLNPNATREKMVEIMFETFHVPALYLSVQALLALYATGILHGLVLDCGDGGNHVVPAYGGDAIIHAMKRFKLSGQDVTDHLRNLLNQRYSFYTTAEREIVNDIKEKLGYVAINYDEELNKSSIPPTLGREFTLPDGTVIDIGTEAFQCTEMMFEPSIFGKECESISQVVHESITNCDVFYQRHLYANVVLAGGTTLFPGFSDRLQKDISLLAPPETKIKIHNAPERKYLTWIGGSILASLDSFLPMFITKDQYNESGPQIVRKIM